MPNTKYNCVPLSQDLREEFGLNVLVAKFAWKMYVFKREKVTGMCI
jgi:hypothetical protein